MQVARAHEMEKISKNRYTADYNVTCQFNDMNTILKTLMGKENTKEQV